MCLTSPELRSASSYGHFTAAKEFRSQCHILSFVGAFKNLKNKTSNGNIKNMKHQQDGKMVAANPRRSNFEKCLKSCFDRLER